MLIFYRITTNLEHRILMAQFMVAQIKLMVQVNYGVTKISMEWEDLGHSREQAQYL